MKDRLIPVYPEKHLFGGGGGYEKAFMTRRLHKVCKNAHEKNFNALLPLADIHLTTFERTWEVWTIMISWTKD